MQNFLTQPFQIGNLLLGNRLIQGPLAGYSCAAMRQLVYQFMPPAYCVSEMLSAQDLLQRVSHKTRYTYRAAEEKTLCYQISGTTPEVMATAASRLEALGADLIDINCGCPKPKIRKQGAGSALLDNPELLIQIVKQTRRAIQIPLTVKIRLQQPVQNVELACRLEAAGADALIVHARRWSDDYAVACDWSSVAAIKQAVSIPVIANGDLSNTAQIDQVYQATGCDAFMIARAGCGQPWLYQSLLTGTPKAELATHATQKALFKQHVIALAALENEHQAILQSQSLVRYYFRQVLNTNQLQPLRSLKQLHALDDALTILSND